MSITRGEIVRVAYGKLGVSSEFEVSPEETVDAIKDLNRMMATWAGNGLRIGFTPGEGADDETGIPDSAEDAVAMNLALRLAPGLGKIPHPELKRDARQAYLAIVSQKVERIPVQLPANMPAGAGNRRFSRRSYVIPPTVPAETGSGGIIDGVDFE